MKVGRLIQNRKLLEKFRAGLLLLCGFFLFGLILGRGASGAVSEDDVSQLRIYLLHYAQVAPRAADMMASFFALLAVYYRYPLLVFLLGFSAAGFFLIPLVCMAQAFFLSFSIHCFARAFGRTGIALALSSLGVRCLVTVPSTLFVALWAMTESLRRMKRQKAFTKQESCWTTQGVLHFLGCVLLLLVGVIVEAFLVPDLISTVLTELT